MRGARRRWPFVVCLAALALASRTALAGNDEAVLLGNQAPLTGGAVTAITSDGAAAWYNPAGLAAARHNTFDINANVYGLNNIRARNLIRLPDGTTGDARVTNWVLIPTTLCYTRELTHKWMGSLGIFVPSSSSFSLRTQLTDREGTSWLLREGDKQVETSYVLGFARSLREGLRVGFTFHAVYASGAVSSQVAAGVSGEPDTPFATSAVQSSQANYGARLGFGVQWDVSPRLQFGASMQTPMLTAYRRSSETDVDTLNPAMGASMFVADDTNVLRPVWKLSTPFRFRAGLAIDLEPARVLVDADFASSIAPGGNSRLDRRPIGNVRVATHVPLSETLAFGVGVFTDLNPRKSYGANYLGLSGGLRTDTQYHLKEGDRTLTFITSLAVRYAYGWGTIPGTEFSFADDDMSLVTTQVPSTLRSHELAAYVGGGISF